MKAMCKVLLTTVLTLVHCTTVNCGEDSTSHNAMFNNRTQGGKKHD